MTREGYHSPKSSTASTTSSTQTSASDDFSPRSLEKHCRPIDVVRMETGVKGTVMERLSHIEDRLLKLEEEMEAERRRSVAAAAPVLPAVAAAPSSEKTSSRTARKSLKSLVRSCVKGKKESNSKPWK
ncbi:OLC1v1001519C1 [Oldenlandia corymbosa var. corymbosa]|uniref:OLC1v1001519C1 n=1 Tax=Oldenlandia corymbosa var. corymbosa TaxID=529605 RepID=A0AAV1D5P7_OLDCO|nr:OLC1v1001519C1 [Oldenlandia corymbosa var. corymbosa]